ncbi:hypothetical protein ACH5A3_29595 [Streptomyces echinatus]|uniref:hypothetical protein n=1 Tax=Streptomyces echinatus TaxID=67293 RepID=UPI00378F5033
MIDTSDTARIRPAVAADVPAVREVTDAAYHPYVERIGVVPRPMEADPAIRLRTNAKMWESQEIYPRYGYELVERRVDGPYDRVHCRKRLD